MSKRIKIGNKEIGGGAPILVQSMLNIHHSLVEENVRQALELEHAGCDILRVAIPNEDAVKLIPAIRSAIQIPLVADIHFDYRLAIKSVAAGVDKIRLNPGNIGSEENVRTVVSCCKAASIPIRVGVNSGSVERDILQKYGGPTADALIESALRHIHLIEKNGYDQIAVSLKASDLKTMVKAYRKMHAVCDYPLHLGVTEAGTTELGTVKSAIGIGSLLLEGIGDTIRVSLTGNPIEEIKAARNILRALSLDEGIEIVSCPTCGRTEIDLIPLVTELETRTRGIHKKIKIAVMGCVVNGPGEAREADLGIAGGKDCAILFRKGEVIRKLDNNYLEELLKEIEDFE